MVKKKIEDTKKNNKNNNNNSNNKNKKKIIDLSDSESEDSLSGGSLSDDDGTISDISLSGEYSSSGDERDDNLDAVDEENSFNKSTAEDEEEDEDRDESDDDFDNNSGSDNEDSGYLSGDSCPSRYVDYDSEISGKSLDLNDILSPTENKKELTGSDRISKPYLTKYEKVRLIGDRTRQLASGAKAMVKNIEGLSSKEIAELELSFNVIPIMIERPLPNGYTEKWHIRELEH